MAFFVEGAKNVTELLLSDFNISHLLFTDRYLSEQPDLIERFEGEKIRTTAAELRRIGTFSSNEHALAVADIKPNLPVKIKPGELVLALDDVRDPGNLGTIIRIADWYGIEKILLSPETADLYNPKVLHASMGSFSRISFQYVDLAEKLAGLNLPVYGAFLEGDSLHDFNGQATGILLMGNESKGIRPELHTLISRKLTIPGFGAAESLNVAIATAVFCDNFRRLAN
ncbi:RNA methyltransferase, TrmH family [Cyclobacterium lianum]|uniref:RNA methyltransferase, TrmH family n=2 Tax=Cyclobacterium lianum TaxID=388280 RepID=A0A1M7NB20_9BACT|nr:RNA methyltransferase, TrmH family [Cyclobacterium lianum]